MIYIVLGTIILSIGMLVAGMIKIMCEIDDIKTLIKNKKLND